MFDLKAMRQLLVHNKQGIKKKAEVKREKLAPLLELYNRGNAEQGQAFSWVFIARRRDVWISLKPVNRIGLSVFCHDALPRWR